MMKGSLEYLFDFNFEWKKIIDVEEVIQKYDCAWFNST